MLKKKLRRLRRAVAAVITSRPTAVTEIEAEEREITVDTMHRWALEHMYTTYTFTRALCNMHARLHTHIWTRCVFIHAHIYVIHVVEV